MRVAEIRDRPAGSRTEAPSVGIEPSGTGNLPTARPAAYRESAAPTASVTSCAGIPCFATQSAMYWRPFTM
jgi:hypothetical protein